MLETVTRPELAFIYHVALRDGAHAPMDDVIMDEFHYDSDHSCGAAWQTSDKLSKISMEPTFPLIGESAWNIFPQ